MPTGSSEILAIEEFRWYIRPLAGGGEKIPVVSQARVGEVVRG